MLQSALNTFGKEKKKKEKNSTITIGFCQKMQKPNNNNNNNIPHHHTPLYCILLDEMLYSLLCDICCSDSTRFYSRQPRLSLLVSLRDLIEALISGSQVRYYVDVMECSLQPTNESRIFGGDIQGTTQR
jgi:hypothetical protein